MGDTAAIRGDAPIRVAVIGYGLGGAVFHAPLVASTPGMDVAAILTSNPERQARARADFPGATIHATAEELWERPDAVDLVVITTPNRFHVPLGLAALEAGLPVVVDKPLAGSAEEAGRLLDAARERGLLLTVFQNRRWDGDFLTVRRLIEEGAIGSVIRYESRFERWRPRRDPGAWRERSGPEDAGGLLFDLGSHLVDQAMVLFGRPTAVYSELERRREGAEVDDDTFVALHHPRGVRSHLWMSAIAGSLGPRLRVLGMAGAYEKHGLDVQEDALASGARPGSPGWGREPRERWGRLTTGGGGRAVQTAPGAYEDFYRGVARSLREGVPPPVDPEDSVAGLRVLEAAVRSATSGTVESLEW